MPSDRRFCKDKLSTIVEPWQDPIPIAVVDRPEDMQFEQIADPVKRKRPTTVDRHRPADVSERKAGRFPRP